MAESATNAVKPVLAAAPSGSTQTGRLTLERVLTDLVADNLVTKEDADRMLADRRINRGEHHPLVVLSEQKLKDPRNPRKTLNLDMLSEWFAGKVGLPYLHVDPFKI